ncbi:hypothetical protein PRELSG_0400300 [Plasmodium relictum]|uniref:Uncharacterized protein n=1 Tax=Plasmodium relictum TaxID=85471 RepID=A0A1J1H283_PLARL|nr:hypothetical protein PRELSG_0400300 [Plasmodium relictum]CRG98655.1 hypothetical protein PRELSG_0400300 [Plasmodium relictum]
MSSTESLISTTVLNSYNNSITANDTFPVMPTINNDSNLTICLLIFAFLFVSFLVLLYICSFHGKLKPLCKRCFICEFGGSDTLELIDSEELNFDEEYGMEMVDIGNDNNIENTKETTEC